MCLCLVVGLTLAVPTVFSVWTIECGLIKQLLVHSVVLAAVAVIGVAWALRGRIRFPNHPLHWAITAFVAIAATASLASDYPYASLKEFWRILMLAGVYAVTVFAVRSRGRLMAVLTGLEVAVFLVCAYGIAQRLGYDFVKFSQSPQDRVFSSVGNPNMLAGYLLMMFWLLIGMAVDSRRWWHRAVILGIECMLLGCLVFTYTKGAWLALAASVAAVVASMGVGWGFFARWRLRRRLLILGGVLGAIVAVGLVFHKPVLGRLYTLRDSADVRRVYWSGATGVLRSHWLWGTGPGTFQIVYPDQRPPDFRARGATYNTIHAHCEPLEILVEMGVIGLAAAAVLLACFFWTSLKMLRPESDPCCKGTLFGIVMGVLALQLHNLVDVNLRWYTTPTLFWMFMGLAVAIQRMAPAATPIAHSDPAPPWRPSVRWAVCAAGLVCLVMLGRSRVVEPFASEAHLRKATDLEQRGQWEEAIVRCDKAIACETANLRAHYQLAYCYYEQKRYGEAIRAYLHLEQLAPNFCQLQYNLAVVYSMMGRWEEAAVRFAKAERMGICPERFAADRFLSKLRENKDDLDRYLAVLKEMIRVNPADPLAHNRLGIYHYERGDLENAKASFDKALEADAQYIPALNNLAGVYYRQRKFSNAIGLCERVLAINANSHQTRVNLGRAWLLVGDPTKAADAWSEVLRRDPANAEARACLKEHGGAAATPNKKS